MLFATALRKHSASVDSTNKQAMEAAAQGAPEGAYFTADEQTAGRGRADHTWHSPAGTGVYVSVVLRPTFEPNDALWLSLIAGLAVRVAIETVTSITPDLRWPNDIMLGEKKMGGILTELTTEAGRIQHAVIGIGLNINQSEFPPELRSLATSLRVETDREWPREEILNALLAALCDEYQRLVREPGARADIIRRFEAYSSYARGAQVEIDDHGAAQFSGMTMGLDERGFLRVKSGCHIRTVFSGGVRKTAAR